jgi:hypothetical protein
MFLVHSTGAVTHAEVQRAIDDILAHPRYGSARKVLVDGRKVTSAPSTSELRAIARDLKPLIDRGFGPMAIVSDPGFVHGVARMFTVFAEVFGLKVRAFTAMQPAEEWLRDSTERVES